MNELNEHPQPLMDLEVAIRVVEENKHWLYKQTSPALDHAIVTLLAYAKLRLEDARAR